MSFEIRPMGPDQVGDFLIPLSAAFGMPITPERIARVRSMPELTLRLGAFEGSAIVGAAGAFSFALTVPGGAALDISGLTMVAVLPTHRRRGILRSLMRSHLDEAHARGCAVAALYASEGSIYGRFGYGIASLSAEVELDRARAAFAGPPGPPAAARLVGEDEAAAVFPAIWDAVRRATPGMLTRSEGWWRARRLSDPDWLRGASGPLQRVLLSLDGRPAAYALYRFGRPFDHGAQPVVLEITEAMGTCPVSTRALFRYLCDVDLVAGIRAAQLSIDHPLRLFAADAKCVRTRVHVGVWVWLVDVCAALSGRAYGEGAPLVLEVEDAFCPWNRGRYRLAGGIAERTAAAADLALDVDALGSVYLGGLGFAELGAAGRVVELAPGALRRADALFRGERAPWSPEIF
jgi:predicted acetyltransferase